MKIFMVHFVALSAIIVLVQSATLKCKTPKDLEQKYKDLQGQNKVPLTLTDTPTGNQNKTCPANKNKEWGFCPSIRERIVDETVFPSIRINTICLCRDCTDPHQLKDCTPIYEQKLFLKRKNNCSGGVYEYVPATLTIPVDCQCKPKRIIDSNLQQDQYDM